MKAQIKVGDSAIFSPPPEAVHLSTLFGIVCAVSGKSLLLDYGGRWPAWCPICYCTGGAL